MIFHENCLLADGSHEISYLFFRKFEKMSQNLSSAVVVIGTLRVKVIELKDKFVFLFQKDSKNSKLLNFWNHFGHRDQSSLTIRHFCYQY